MANRVTIDVEARLIDNVSKNADKISSSTGKANKELDKLGKKNVKPRLGADDNAFTKKIREAQQKAEKLGKTKASATLGAIDKATSKIGQVTGAARAFAGKTFRGAISVADKASNVIGSVTGAARSFAGKTFSAAVKIVDYATTPLRKIKEQLFSIKTLIGTVVAGMATKKFVLDPINLADSYSSAKIGFSTLLGETEGQKMMDEIDKFAKATPFKTSGVISNVQKMMAYGWDAERVIKDMETIGDAAAATGKGDEGLESIVYALSEIKSKGKLSTQELNQLASAGIKAKQYLAQGLGYGTDDTGMAKLMEDLEDGAVGANQAIELILQGMEEFDGMMDKTANETVEGLKSQIEDTFEINVFRRWGQGLQDGAKKGLGYIVSLLDNSEGALKTFGDMVYDIGKSISNWGAEKLGNFVERVKAVVQTPEFKKASLGGKIKILWNETIVDPLKRWWNSDGVQKWLEEKKEWLASKVEGFGKSIGTGLSKGLLAIFGVDVTGVVEEGANLGASFGKGFAEGFDGSAVTDALISAVKRAWEALPTWAKVLVGGYGVGKVTTGVGNLIGGIGNIVNGVSGLAPLIGSTGNTMMRGTGLLSGLASAGYAMTGGAAGSALSGGMAALAGAGGITGLALGAYGLASGGRDFYHAYKADRSTELGKEKTKAYATSGGAKVGGVAAGAAIGTAILPGLGSAIGAGVGYLVGKFAGDKAVENYEKMEKEAEKAKYSSERMKEAIEDGSYSAAQMQEIFEAACWEDLKDRFGAIKLSMEEINTLAKTTVFGNNVEFMENFDTSTKKAEESLQNFKTKIDDMKRLNFDMSERNWKINMGLKGELTDEEKEEVIARVQSYIDSAEAALSDQHFQFNTAVEMLLKPEENGDNSMYDQIIEHTNEYFINLQKELDGHSEELKAQYNIALEDGVITADEQKIISEIQGKIAEILDKVSQAETEASFEVAKLKFTTGDITAESCQQFMDSLQSYLDTFIQTQDEGLILAMSKLKIQLNDGAITKEQYDSEVMALVEGYESNIDNMVAQVNQIQLEGIAEAFDEVGTVEELQSAIDNILTSGKDPLKVTFDDISAELNLSDDVLSEEGKANFLSMMRSAIQSATSGEDKINQVVDINVAPSFEYDVTAADETTEAWLNIVNSALQEKLDGADTISPEMSIIPQLTVPAEKTSELKEKCETEVSNYLTGENALTPSADGHVRIDIYGTGGIPLSEEASAGRTEVQSEIDTSFSSAFSTSADANVTLNWNITNPTANVSLGSNGSKVTASIAAAENAAGDIINDKTLSWIAEEGPESIIPLVPGRRARALKLWEETGKRLGVQYHAAGGIVGDDSAPLPSFNTPIQNGSGEQKIEINMGGVTIEIKADGSKSMVDNIEEQEEEIANKVAEVFTRVFSAQFANMPLRGGT